MWSQAHPGLDASSAAGGCVNWGSCFTPLSPSLSFFVCNTGMTVFRS